MNKRTKLISLMLIFLMIGTLGSMPACKKTEKDPPKLTFDANLSLEEGTAIQQFAVLKVTLSSDFDQAVTMLYQTTDGTAKAGEDYVAVAEGQLVFQSGETTKEISIPIIQDALHEADEDFSLIVTKVTNASLGQSQCKITLVNDDAFVPEIILPERVRVSEGQATTTLKASLRISGVTTNTVSLKWSTVDGTAIAGEDYVAVADQVLTFEPGEIQKQFTVEIMQDDVMELDDAFYIHISDVQNATFVPSEIPIIINNDDGYTLGQLDDGPVSPESYPRFDLIWSDEFDGTAINTQNWGYNTGAGGWGNSELQTYTSSAVNSFVQDGKLNIVATKLYNAYYSARLLSQNKKTFTYGRIDIRAKMPIGKGIWPALWMLGNNISQVSWPRCGEIDIMEFLGHVPKEVHGTVHYYNGGHRYTGGHYNLTGAEGFNDKFHVFTIMWDEFGIKWYVDYQKYYEIEDTDIQFEAFKLPQFFIMNVAVGGVWPGYPDETTTFPQTMQVDYVRVFQYPASK